MNNIYKYRKSYVPKLPSLIDLPHSEVCVKFKKTTINTEIPEDVKKQFSKTFGQKNVSFEKGGTSKKIKNLPLNVVVVLSGGQAPGGHNVIAGVYDSLKKYNKNSKLYGAIGGPDGLVDGKIIKLDKNTVDKYRGTGGFDIITSGRGKITKKEQFENALAVCKKHSINAIVIIGGDDSNTNAAFLAEYFKNNDENGIVVVGCPKTIDGDLKNSYIETSFGFDTATKTYSELIGNLQKDAISAKKYWFFIRLMGRSASHVALECALQTHPNICLIGEEIKNNKNTFNEVASYVASIIKERSKNKKNYGVCLIPEGIVEFIPEIETLIKELNDVLSSLNGKYDVDKDIVSKLSSKSKKCWTSLPESMHKSLLSERDPHGNVQVSKIQSEILLGEAVAEILKKEGVKFSPIYNFFGYEGRSAYPSNFDNAYCYALGYNAVLLIENKLSGYMSTVSNLTKSFDKWRLGGIPIVSMFDIEIRNGHPSPVIKKALVNLQGNPFKEFLNQRKKWAKEDDYISPGPIQYFGPEEICNSVTITLSLENKKV